MTTNTDRSIEDLALSIKLTSSTKLTADQLIEAFTLLRQHWISKSNIAITIDVAVIKG